MKLYLRASDAGYTLMEMLVVMSIFIILAFLALPMVPELIGSFNRRNASNYVEYDFRRARAEAVAQGVRSILTIDSGGWEYNVGLDLVPFSNSGTPDSLLFERYTPKNITVSASDDIIFDSRGYLIDAAGNLNSATITLNYDSTAYCSGTVEATGILELSCNE